MITIRETTHSRQIHVMRRDRREPHDWRMLMPTDAERRAPLIALSLPEPVCNGRMLWFQRLARSEGVAGVLTLGWRFRNEVYVDPWSIRFNAFKFDVRAAVVDAAAAICIKALGELDSLRGPIAFTAALPVNDTRLQASSRLAVLGRRLAACRV